MAKELRPYQINMKNQIYAAWDKGDKNVLLVLPTGLGKTYTFCSIAMDMALNPANRLPTAIMVHRKELVQQISLTLAEEQITHNIIAPKNVILGIVGAQRKVYNKQFYDYHSPISVISVDTLNARIAHHEKWAKGIRLWITDEAAHLLRDNKWGRAIEYFPNAIGLGVTATPERLDKKGLGRHADGVFDSMVEGPSTRWGITNGFLCKYKLVVPKSDYESHLKGASGTADFPRPAMVEAAEKSQIIGDVVKNYLKFAKGKQAILFAPSISIADDMEAKFLSAGVPSKVLTGNSTDMERLQGILDFKSKKIKVLLNVDLFDEGLDDPGIECVIHARPTMSFSKYRQMNGRGMRPSPDKDAVIIIDHVGNIKRHGYPDRSHKWTLDRIVKRKKKFDLMRICENPECASPFERKLTECPWCGQAVESSGSGGGGRTPPEQVDGDLFLIDPFTLSEMEKDTLLESPADIQQRVTAVAGVPAGIRAAKNQIERINIQEDLKKAIAIWAGLKRDEGLSDRSIHKEFFLLFEKTIAQALSEPAAKMIETMEGLDEERGGSSTTYSDRGSQTSMSTDAQQ